MGGKTRKDPEMSSSPRTELTFDVRPSASPVPRADRERILEAPGLAQVFPEHMVTIPWTAEAAWHDARVEPYGPLTLDPSTSDLHYAQEFFEGLKASLLPDGSVA